VLGLLSGIIVLAVIAEVLFHKLRIPEQIILLLFGVAIGYAGVISGTTHSYLLQVAPVLGTFVLGLILLDAGFGMKAYDILIRSPRIFAVASLDPIIQSVALSVIMHFLLGWPWLYGAMFGSLIASTTPEVLVPLVRAAGLDEATQNTIILGSAYNGVTSIILFEALFGIAQSSSVNLGAAVSGLVLAFLVGIAIGLISGLAWALVALKRITDHQYVITMAAAFGVYVGSELLGGNGFLSILVFAIMIGNYNESYRKVLSSVVYGVILGRVSERLRRSLRISNDSSVESLRRSQKEITFVAKTFFFIYLGILFNFTLSSVVIGVALSFMLVGLEYVSVNIVRLEANTKLLSFLVPRGISPVILVLTFYAYASNQLATAPSPAAAFINRIAQQMNSITFTIIFSTIIIAVVSAVLLTGGKSARQEKKRGNGEELSESEEQAKVAALTELGPAGGATP
jgi:cell volume regulation protein A